MEDPRLRCASVTGPLESAASNALNGLIWATGEELRCCCTGICRLGRLEEMASRASSGLGLSMLLSSWNGEGEVDGVDGGG